jgi:type I restriction enzyme S subunit
LGEICQFKNGLNFEKGNQSNGTRVITVADFQSHFTPRYETLPILVADRFAPDRLLLRKNDVVFVRSNGNKALIGRTLFVDAEPFPMTLSAFCIRARPVDANVLPAYLAYWTRSGIFRHRLRSLTRGTNIGNISQKLLSSVALLIPPLAEQERVVELFRGLDHCIDLAEMQESTLCRLRQRLVDSLGPDIPQLGSLTLGGVFQPRSIGQLAQEVTDRIEDPSTSPLDRFVGLEHMASGEPTIESWASTKGLVSAMKLFRAGDVLFARRNAYLRRTSQATFDGVCSGDATVIRARPTKIRPTYLTLLLNTDNFWRFATANAAGSMSKRVKWRDLESYSVQVPDLVTQDQVLGFFSELNKPIAELRALLITLRSLRAVLLNTVLG